MITRAVIGLVLIIPLATAPQVAEAAQVNRDPIGFCRAFNESHFYSLWGDQSHFFKIQSGTATLTKTDFDIFERQHDGAWITRTRQVASALPAIRDFLRGWQQEVRVPVWVGPAAAFLIYVKALKPEAALFLATVDAMLASTQDPKLKAFASDLAAHLTADGVFEDVAVLRGDSLEQLAVYRAVGTPQRRFVLCSVTSKFVIK